jgi:hypothetical protein
VDAETGCSRSLAAHKDNYKGVPMTDIEQQERIEVFVGIDVGKAAYDAIALDLTGNRLLANALPNDEAKLRALITKLK